MNNDKIIITLDFNHVIGTILLTLTTYVAYLVVTA